MRAVLSIVGPLAAVRPLLTLAAALRRRGHAPVLVLSPEYAATAARVRVPAKFLPGLSQTTSSANPHAELPPEMLAATVLDVYRNLAELCRNADVLIATPGQLA